MYFLIGPTVQVNVISKKNIILIDAVKRHISSVISMYLSNINNTTELSYQCKQM